MKRLKSLPIVGPVLRRRLPREVALLQASNTLQKGYGAVYNVLSFRLLGDTAYGEVRLVLSLYNTVNLLGTLGLGQFMVVPLAQAAAAGDREEVARACGFNVKASLLISALVLVLALAAGPLIGQLVYASELGRQLGHLMRIVALGAVPSVAYTLTTSSLQSVRRMRELAIVENVDAVLFRAVAVLALLLGRGAPGMLWGMAIGGGLSACFALFQYRRVLVGHHGFPDFAELARAAWGVPLTRYLRFSAFSVLDKNVAQFFGQTPLLFLGRFAGPEQAAYYDVAAKVFGLLHAFHGAGSRALSVRLSQVYAESGVRATRRLFWRSLALWGGLSILASAAFACLLPLFRWVYTAQAFPSVALVVLWAAFTAKQGFTISLGAIYLILDRVAINAAVKIPLLLGAMPVGAWLVSTWSTTLSDPAAAAVSATAYILGAYLVGDAIYFGLLAAPRFWRPPRARPAELAAA
ncbi:MAG TPA: lipopolysaccharide biosynthesis protein [Chloroflexota bacterium]|nr:lipopolysaccharide biosynthesis protein [Chloroflexota bacterium]